MQSVAFAAARWLWLPCLVVACGCGGAEPAREAHTTDPPAEWVAHADARKGVTVAYPRGWRVAEEPLTPHLAEPVEVLHAATYPLRPGGDRCAHVPENALEDLGPGDALVSVYEQTTPSETFPSRPPRFVPSAGSAPESAQCLERPDSPELLYRLHRFEDAGRRFYVYVAIGVDAGAETRDEAARVVESLRFERARR